MAEVWPDEKIAYQFPTMNADNQRRWQKAITSAIGGNTLWIEHHPDRSDFADLLGACPRCGHPMHQSLEFDVILGIDKVTKSGTFNIDCTCSEDHGGRPKDNRGCGWGGANEVRIET